MVKVAVPMLRRFSFWSKVVAVATVVLYTAFHVYVLIYHLNVDSAKLLWATAVVVVALIFGFVGLFLARNWNLIKKLR